MLLFDFDLKEGLLVGAVLASTDGAAIFALLRNSTLRRRLARTLEGESGLNDPVAVLLVLALIESIKQPGYGLDDVVLLLVQQLGIGLVGRPRRRLARGPGLPARAARDRRASTRWPRSRPPRWPSAAPTRCTARASSPSTSPG